MSKFVRFAVLGAALTVPIGAYAFVLRPWSRRWGVDPDETAKPLPGDDIVADASAVETRGITIDAAPEDVWPWLVQMGYGRAGFYSYDRLDAKTGSATTIVPEWQDLAVGGTVPTHPTGGFDVRVLEPGKALVLYVDSQMAETWAPRSSTEATPPGLQASGAFMGGSMPKEFAGTWALVVERTPEGRTRLVERLRFHFGATPQPGMRVAMNALAFGMFLMVRKQLLGIQNRAEALAQSKLPAVRENSGPLSASPPFGVPGAAAPA